MTRNSSYGVKLTHLSRLEVIVVKHDDGTQDVRHDKHSCGKVMMLR